MMSKHKLAKAMRRALTPPEFLLWNRIKQRQTGGPVFYRQYVFGPYILDFYCIKAWLAVEVDGSMHDSADAQRLDEQRDAWLRSEGVMVYRMPAADIFRDPDGAADGVILLATERLKSR